jgi:hypothetical protein
VSGVSRNRGGFVKCVAIQKRLGIPALEEELETLRLDHSCRGIRYPMCTMDRTL